MMVNAIGGNYPDFRTGMQDITEVAIYVNVLPDEYSSDDIRWTMESVNGLDSSEETVGVVKKANELTPGRHTLHVQATDSDGYRGPVSSIFVDISETEVSLRGSSLRGAKIP